MKFEIWERPRQKLRNFFVGQGSAKISYLLQEKTNLYAANLYFLWALIFNGEGDMRLIRKRPAIKDDHPLRGILNAVRYVVEVAEYSYVFPK